MKPVIKLSTIDVALLIISLVPIIIIPHTVKVLTKYLIIIYLLFRYFSWNNIKKNSFIVILIIIYTIILSYSTHINTSSFTWTLAAFMTGMQYLVMFLLFYTIANKRHFEVLTRNLMRVIGLLLLLNDLLIPFIQFHSSNPDELYLLGNKFSVSYLHCLFVSLIYICQKGKLMKKTCIILFIYSMVISFTVGCTTGIIIAIALILMTIFSGIIQRIVSIPFAFPIALAIENILIWGSTNLFKQSWMVNIITNVCHKSADMTGRERLYSVTLMLVEKKPLFGYGHNTDIYRDMFGYGNAQNGLFHVVTQVGIIGAAVYFFMITYALTYKKKDNCVYGLYMFVYAMLIASAIEINLSGIFLMAVAMIYAFQMAPLEYSGS